MIVRLASELDVKPVQATVMVSECAPASCVAPQSVDPVPAPPTLRVTVESLVSAEYFVAAEAEFTANARSAAMARTNLFIVRMLDGNDAATRALRAVISARVHVV